MKKLTVESFRDLFPGAGIRHYQKNQIVGYHGDKPQYVFFVLRGHVKYYDVDPEGNEKILHINGPQNIFPMLYAFGVSEDINGFYCTLDEVEVLAVPLTEFHTAIESNIEFCNALTRWFLSEIQQLVFRVNSFEKTDSREKIINTLNFLALHFGHKNGVWQKIDFPITQQFLADFTGLTRETVSNVIQELEKKNIVRPGKLRTMEIRVNKKAMTSIF